MLTRPRYESEGDEDASDGEEDEDDEDAGEDEEEAGERKPLPVGYFHFNLELNLPSTSRSSGAASRQKAEDCPQNQRGR